MTSRRRARDRVLLHAATLVLVLVVLAPFLWLLQMSFKTQADIFAFPPRLAFVPTVEHYRTIWDTAFRRSFANSAVVAVLSTALALVLGVPGAYALSPVVRPGFIVLGVSVQ